MTTQVLSPSNNSNNIGGSNNFLTKFWAVQRCDALESPVIFTNWSDFNVYLNSHHKQQDDDDDDDDDEAVAVNVEGEEQNNGKQQGRQKDVNDIIYEEFDNILDAVQYILPQEQPLIIPRTSFATTTITTTMTTTGTKGRGGGGGEIPVTTQETKKTTMARTPIAINTTRTKETGTGTTTRRTFARRNVENMDSPPNFNERSNATNNHLHHQDQKQQQRQQLEHHQLQRLHQLKRQQLKRQQQLLQISFVPPRDPMYAARNPLHGGGSTGASVDPGWRPNTSIVPPIRPPVPLYPSHNSNNNDEQRKGNIENDDTLGVATREFYKIRGEWRTNLMLYEEFVKQFPPGYHKPRLSRLSSELQKKYSCMMHWLMRSKALLRNYYSNDRTSMSDHEIIKSKVLQQFCIQIGYDPITWAQKQQRAARSRGGRGDTADADNDDNTKKRKKARIGNEASNDSSRAEATDDDDDDNEGNDGYDDDDEGNERGERKETEKEQIMTTTTEITPTETTSMETSPPS